MNDVLVAAILQATADGDTATGERLKALADRPDELKQLRAQLSGSTAGAGART